MLNKNNNGFTLVELIVVITILAILGVIGFISLQGFSSEARDSKRITDLGQIRTGIQVYQAKEGVVPEPDDAITVSSGSTIYNIQGYIGTGTLRSIKVNTDALDPLEDSYYTYTTNGAKTKFQLLALLENNNTSYNFISKTYANFSNRFPYTIGSRLGTLLQTNTRIPIQELGNNIDLKTSTTVYIPVFKKGYSLSYSGSQLLTQLKENINNPDLSTIEKSSPPIIYSSCKQLLLNEPNTGNGLYEISPNNDENTIEVFCDMSTDGGGWTVFRHNNTYSNTTNQTVELIDPTIYNEFLEVKNNSSEINILSDLDIIYQTDTPQAGCSGTPYIYQGEMNAKTLSFNDLSNNTITTRNFYGASDHESMKFNNTLNQFYLNRKIDYATCNIASRFGINEPVIIKSLKLLTYSSEPNRKHSKISGSYYHIMLR